MMDGALMARGKRVVVTGGSGFVGTNLVQQLVSRGWSVRNVDHLPPRDYTHVPYWQELDILDRTALLASLQQFRPSVLVHLAARTDMEESAGISGYAANIDGVRNLLDAVRGTPSIERALFASSQLVCRLGYRPKHEDDFSPDSLYGRSKAIGEQTVRNSRDIGAVWTILRPTSLWGPWFAEPYRAFFEMIERGWYVHVRDHDPLKQWGYIGNTVHQMIRLIDSPATEVNGRTFYLADYVPISLATFANKVQKAMRVRPIRKVPYHLLKVAAHAGDALQHVGYSKAPLTSFRLRNMITPEVQDLVPLEKVVGPIPYTVDEGIRATVDWLRSGRGSTRGNRVQTARTA